MRTFDISVARLLEKLHQNGLHRLALVQQCLSANFKTANALKRNLVLLQQGSHHCAGLASWSAEK
jgi:hypothetical protein